MKNYSTKRKIGVFLGWTAVVACMAVIFHLSHQPSEESSELSLSLLSSFFAIFSQLSEIIGHETFRTIAHGLEYCGLGALLFHALLQTFGKAKPFVSFAFAAAYAVTDEIHQIFIPGRAFQVSDIAVDWLGAISGIAVCTAIFVTVKKILDSREPLTNS